MWTYYLAFCIACVSIVCEACESGWSANGDSCYKYFPQRKNWHDAKAFCESQQGYLAIVMSLEENAFLKKLLRNQRIGSSDQVWMDGDDLKTETHFVWENTGEGFEITDWGPNEPNQSGGNEDCLSFFAIYDFKWNDEHCDKPFGFLCEKAWNQPRRERGAMWSIGDCLITECADENRILIRLQILLWDKKEIGLKMFC